MNVAPILQWGAFVNQAIVYSSRSVSKRQHSPDELAQILRISQFGNEFRRPERPRVARIQFVALAGKHDDVGFRGMRENVCNQGKAFIRAVGRRRQA